MNSLHKTSLIAPCGINCALCAAFQRDRNRCPGCQPDDSGKPITRVRCRMKTCEHRQDSGARFCFDCPTFPCDTLAHLDTRYRTKYAMSPIANLEFIRDSGIRKFLKAESDKWTCPTCGGTICVHKARCLSCGWQMR